MVAQMANYEEMLNSSASEIEELEYEYNKKHRKEFKKLNKEKANGRDSKIQG